MQNSGGSGLSDHETRMRNGRAAYLINMAIEAGSQRAGSLVASFNADLIQHYLDSGWVKGAANQARARRTLEMLR